jgi:hypothetical protein
MGRQFEMNPPRELPSKRSTGSILKSVLTSPWVLCLPSCLATRLAMENASPETQNLILWVCGILQLGIAVLSYRLSLLNLVPIYFVVVTSFSIFAHYFLGRSSHMIPGAGVVPLALGLHVLLICLLWFTLLRTVQQLNKNQSIDFTYHPGKTKR